MKLGILINTARHLDQVLGITQAALAKNHEVILFAMDEGTKFLENKSFVSLAGLKGVTLSVCEHSAKHYAVRTEGLPPAIKCGSQLNNAMMNHNADRVVVL